MASTSGIRYPLIVQIFLFMIPVNIYVLGDWLASGIQWILFRYQQSYLGDCVIGFYRDFFYLATGILKGKSACAAVVGSLATSILILAVILLVMAYYLEEGTWVKKTAVLNIAGGCLFLVSDFFQYGLLLSGPSGFVIPVGIPVIIGASIWMFRLDVTGDTTKDSIVPEIPDEHDNDEISKN